MSRLPSAQRSISNLRVTQGSGHFSLTGLACLRPTFRV